MNNAPTFTGTIPDITGSAGVAITPVDLHSYFADTDTLTYSISPAGTALPSGLTINSSTCIITGTVAAASTTVGVKVRATDTASQSVDSNAFNVVIASGPTQVPYNDPAIIFSPGNWDDRGTYKSANTPGAYAKMTFTGTSIIAKFDTSFLSAASVSASSYPIVRIVIDGKTATDTKISTGTPNVTVSGLTAGTHTIEMYFRAIDVNLSDRWGATSGAQPVSALVFKGFTLDAGATYSASTVRSKVAMAWGDSISEGYITISASNPDGNSALQTVWPFIAEALDCEYGVLGYSAQGYEKTGNAGVPTLYNATSANSPINYFSNGRSRLTSGTFTTMPDYVFVMHGANGTTTQTGVTGVIDTIRAAAPNVKIFIFVPAGGYARSAITAGVAARSTDAKLFLIDLGVTYQPGMDSSGNGGQYSNDNGLHPNLLGNAKAAAGYIAKVQAKLDGVVTQATTARTFSVTLADSSGVLANLSNLSVALYDQATLGSSTAPIYKTETVSTNSSGVLSITVQSTLSAGATGRIEVRATDGRHYNGQVVVL